MAKSRVVRVTPNLLRCIKDLKAAVKNIPAGKSQAEAKAALDYLVRTFAGERQPAQGKACEPPRTIIR